MKKLLLVFLVMAMCVSLCACSATIEKEKLVGIWSLEDGTNVVSITFNENNKFSCEYNGAKSEGSYGLFGGDVYLNFPEGKPNLFGEGARSVFTYNGESITLDNLSLLKTSIDKGHLVEFGTHQELLDMKGFYWRLVMAQRQDSGMLDKANKILAAKKAAQ